MHKYRQEAIKRAKIKLIWPFIPIVGQKIRAREKDAPKKNHYDGDDRKYKVWKRHKTPEGKTGD